MKVSIKKGIAKGCVDAPPSKSMAHRMLICAGLSGGECVVHGIAQSKDIQATMDCLKAIGVKCEYDGSSVFVKGIDVKTAVAEDKLQCRESGSTLRFFIPICLASGQTFELIGAQRLLERPLGVYSDLCKEKKLYFSQDAKGVTVKGPLKPGSFSVPGNVSSQFISGLLFVLPLLDGDSTIEITLPIESKSYIDMTILAMRQFGVIASWQDGKTIYLKGNQRYCPCEVSVEGDYSNSAFLDAFNLIGGQVQVGNLSKESIQGDKVYTEMFGKLESGCPVLEISDCPDLAPVLFAMAGVMNGATFKGTKRLKIKESDRGETMAAELKKFGIKTEIYDNEIIVEPAELKKPEEAIFGHNDHRIVMANAVLLTLTGGIIEGAEAVTKSFPDFFEKLSSLGIEVEKIEDK